MINSMVKEKSKISGIGIAAAGIMDVEEGTLKPARLLPYKMYLLGPLKEAYKVPINVANDCNAAVLAERDFGAGKGYDNLAYVTFSTGIGCGLIKGGKLVTEDGINSMELGDIPIKFEGIIECQCGGYNHWESFSSGRGIPKFAKYLLEHKYKNSELDGGKLSTERIFELAKDGNETALGILEEVGNINGFAFSKIIEKYQPGLITIGGSIALKNFEVVAGPIRNYLKRSGAKTPKIIMTPLKEDVVILGAFALANCAK